MLNAVVRSLGVVLETEDLERAREAYSLAVTHIYFHKAEFAHVQSRTLSTRLAHLVIRLVRNNPENDSEKLSQQALSVLRYPDIRNVA
jgi:N-acetylmuramoyl-L-alanine amidase